MLRTHPPIPKRRSQTFHAQCRVVLDLSLSKVASVLQTMSEHWNDRTRFTYYHVIFINCTRYICESQKFTEETLCIIELAVPAGWNALTSADAGLHSRYSA